MSAKSFNFRVKGFRRVKNQNNQICGFGRKGRGKTVLASEYIALADRPVVAIDPMAEFVGPVRHPEGNRLLFEGQAVKPSHVADALEEAFAMIEETGSMKPAEFVFSVYIKPEGPDIHKKERIEILHRVLSVCFEVGNLIVVVDEADQYCSPSTIPASFSDIVNRGRHRQVDLIVLSRRPARVHRDITANADLWHVFQTVEARDLEYFSEVIPPDQQPEIAKLPGLQTGQFITFQVG